MRRLTLEDIKNRKHYLINTYRRQVKWLQYSLILLLIECGVIAFMYFLDPQPDYYSTNSASAIQAIKAIEAPNYSQNALLPPDLPEEMGRKTLDY